MSLVSLDGIPVVSALITIPWYGLWTADVKLATGDQPSATGCKLVIGSLSMIGSVVRGADFQGSTTTRLIGGFGGWRKAVGSKWYSLAMGVQLSMVAKDAARDVGEQVSIVEDRIIGAQYLREHAPAGRVLSHLAGGNWYVRPDGVTVIGERVGKAITSVNTITKYHGGAGIAEIATEVPEDYVPANIFQFATVARTISAVTHKIRGASVRTEIMVNP